MICKKKIFKIFTNIFRDSKRERIFFDEIFFIYEKIEKKNFLRFINNALQKINETHFIKSKRYFIDQLYEELVDHLNKITISVKNPEKYRYKYGLNQRLFYLKLIFESTRKVSFNKNINKVLNELFVSNFNVVGWSLFEKVSPQAFHINKFNFFTNILNYFFRVWNVLEDIKEGFGPLIYYIKWHFIKLNKDLHINKELPFFIHLKLFNINIWNQN